MVSRPVELEDYPVVIRLPVLWGDQDAFGHVNNTLSFRWFESSRIAYLENDMIRSVMMRDGFGPILAHIECNFRRQIHYPDNVLVGGSIRKLGRSSFQMSHLIYSESQEAVVSDGDSTLVAFSFSENKSRPIPDDLRSVIEQIEGRDLSE